MEALAIIIPVLVVLAGIVLFAAMRRRERSDALGLLSRETIKRDAAVDVEEGVEHVPTGREVERAAVLERAEPAADLVKAETAPPAEFVPPDEETVGVYRRQFLNRSIVGATALSSGIFGAAVVGFLWPQGGGGFGSDIKVGLISDVKAQIQAANGFLYKPEGRMWLTEYPSGALENAVSVYGDTPAWPGIEAGVMALFQKCPHLGCRVPDCVTSQWFECPCHGSQYNQVGEKRGGPAPRGMDYFATSVSDGVLTVKTGTIVQGTPIGTDTTKQSAEGPNCLGESTRLRGGGGDTMLILAASTQRTIGWILAIIVLLGVLIALYFNIRSAKAEMGSEIELAPNRRPYYADEELEGPRLDRALSFSLVMLLIIAVTLPLYWLAEPARQERADEGEFRKLATRGGVNYEELCSACHGPGATGGGAPFTITGSNGEFAAQVNWTAPALTTVLTRFSEDEVRHVLNFGRNGVMPAWGAPGGGPLTTQQVTELIYYLRTIQIGAILDDEGNLIGAEGDELVQEQVMAGVALGAKERLLAEDPEVMALRSESDEIRGFIADNQPGDEERASLETAIAGLEENIDAAVDAYVARISDPSSDEFAVYGELLFNNSAAAGQYSCARCHSAGFSYGATSEANYEELISDPAVAGLADKGLLRGYEPGGGWFGPNLTGGSTVVQFPDPANHEAFIAVGSQRGVLYGQAGQGSGQMPGFAARRDDDVEITWAQIYTPEQIAAIAEYERSL